jgi:hypothetical protein
MLNLQPIDLPKDHLPGLPLRCKRCLDSILRPLGFFVISIS